MNKLFTFIVISFFVGFAACNDPVDNSCYDPELVEMMRDSICDLSCEGVCACNNQTYCNECEAMKAGYKIHFADTLPCGQR